MVGKYINMLFIIPFTILYGNGTNVCRSDSNSAYSVSYRELVNSEKELDFTNKQDTLDWSALDVYLDEYYSYYYSYPSSIDSILFFMQEINGGSITKDSYYGEEIIEYMIPLLNFLKDKSFIIIDEESFKIYNLENKLIYLYEPPSGTPCKYIKFINEDEDGDQYILSFHSNILFFDIDNKAIIKNVSSLTTEFSDLRKSVLEEQKGIITPHYNNVGAVEYAFYEFDSQTGLRIMCGNNVDLNNKFYQQLNQQLYEFTRKYHISRIIFCTVVYKDK